MKLTRLSVYDIALISVFVAVIAVCSLITIPLGIPFTMQIFGVFLAIGVLGAKRSVVCVTAYLFLGAVGAPVFSSFQGGLHVLIGQTGGFLIGFVLSAIIMGLLIKRAGCKLVVTFLSMLVGLLVCYVCGILWLVTAYRFELLAAVAICAPLVVFDIIKVAFASAFSIKLRKFVR